MQIIMYLPPSYGYFHFFKFEFPILQKVKSFIHTFVFLRAEQNFEEIDEEMSNVVTDDEQKWRNYICSFYLHDTFEMIECWDL